MDAESRQTGALDTPPVHQTARPRELQDGLNRHLYHPLAWRLALWLARTPVTPNAVSVAGGMLVIAAGLAYVGIAWPLGAVAGLLLHMSWHVVDGADGDLARLTGGSSPRGELVDGICDYASHVVLYVLLGFQLQQSIGAIAWLPTFGAGISRIVQANYYEAQRRQYQWWAYGASWLRQSQKAGVGGLGRVYLALAARTAPGNLLEAAIERCGDDPAARSRVRQVVRDNNALLLPRSPLLGANYRTIGLGLAMLAGSPLWFFLYEAIALNLVLVWAIWRSAPGEHAVAARVAQALSDPALAKTCR